MSDQHLTIAEARGWAARIWCEPEHSAKEMDSVLAESIAHQLVYAYNRGCREERDRNAMTPAERQAVREETLRELLGVARAALERIALHAPLADECRCYGVCNIRHDHDFEDGRYCVEEHMPGCPWAALVVAAAGALKTIDARLAAPPVTADEQDIAAARASLAEPGLKPWEEITATLAAPPVPPVPEAPSEAPAVEVKREGEDVVRARERLRLLEEVNKATCDEGEEDADPEDLLMAFAEWLGENLNTARRDLYYAEKRQRQAAAQPPPAATEGKRELPVKRGDGAPLMCLRCATRPTYRGASSVWCYECFKDYVASGKRGSGELDADAARWQAHRSAPREPGPGGAK